MTFLQYKTRHSQTPYHKAKVYLCVHPEDFPAFSSDIANEILALHDCAVWYADPNQHRDDAFLSALTDMNLFVMPVTKRLLTTKSHAIEKEFAFAAAHHIPVLPLMQEPGLVNLFNEVCGNLQFLDPHVKDLTAISYKEKLAKYLDEVLLDDETVQKIQAAFDAYIFLSYRKTDRAFAQELMGLIHENDFCRDIAIWYDEFLTPGEDFNAMIQAALKKSDLFVMTVTPQLVAPASGSTQDNYIVQAEYPLARQAGKPILPVEMAQTNDALLDLKFKGLPPRTKGSNKAALAAALQASLTQVALRKNDSPVHDFFIGLAYLKGIDVEVNHQKAVQLIQASANANVLQAVETMVQLYNTGTGVERSNEKMLQWQQRLVQLRQNEYNASHTAEAGLALLQDLQFLQQLHEAMGNTEQAFAAAQQLTRASAVLRNENPCAEANRYFCAGMIYTGQLLTETGRAEEARKLFSSSESILRQTLAGEGIMLAANAIRMPAQAKPLHMRLLQDYCTSLCNLGDATVKIAESTRDPKLSAEAFRYFEQCRSYLESPVMENNYPGYRAQLSAAYSRMATIEQSRDNYPAARIWLDKSIRLDIQNVLEFEQIQDPDAYDELARSLLAYAMVDQKDPGVLQLHAALEIWETLSILLPEYPQYKEYYEDLKPYAEYWIAKARQEKSHIKYALNAKVYPDSHLTDAMNRLRKLKEQQQRKKKERQDFLMLYSTVANTPTAENQYELATRYLNGIGTEVDKGLALAYAKKSADQDHLPAIELAVQLLQNTNEKEAEKYRSKAEAANQVRQQRQWLDATTAEAKAGNAKACIALANYYYGEYQPTQAYQWIELAMRQNYTPAFILAARHHRSRGNYKAGKYYAKQAIKRKDPQGCMFMETEADLRGTPLGKLYWSFRYKRMRKQETKRIWEERKKAYKQSH